VKITNVSAPTGEWRFGRIVWRDYKGHTVRSPIAVRAREVAVPDGIAGEGADGATSFDVGFGYDGTYSAGVHGLVEPFLQLIPDIPQGGQFVYGLPVSPGAVYAQWSLFDEYIDGAHDFDLFLFFCPPDLTVDCVQVDSSLGATSAETVSVKFPIPDDPTSPDDAYVLLIDAFATEGGAPADIITFDWVDPAPAGDEGNMTASGPSTATVGGSGTVDVTWTGLPTGAAEKQVGAISHNDASGPLEVTSVNIKNDDGFGFCDLVPCP
jgi:hypothetical protein